MLQRRCVTQAASKCSWLSRDLSHINLVGRPAGWRRAQGVVTLGAGRLPLCHKTSGGPCWFTSWLRAGRYAGAVAAVDLPLPRTGRPAGLPVVLDAGRDCALWICDAGLA